MATFMNPSRSAVIYDPVLNIHIQPGQKVNKCDPRNVLRGYLVEVKEPENPQAASLQPQVPDGILQEHEPIMVTAVIQDPATASARPKARSRARRS